ncbi:hypothetical protein BJ165DRAFT_647787 [Panaeolus papilionaceus]|nr:hypothetical protein BJ165DRAFT_647787 [Panaeolus papilionaceus]
MAFFNPHNPHKGSSGPGLKEERDRAGRHKQPMDDMMSAGANPGVIGGPDASKGASSNPLMSIFSAGGGDASFFGMEPVMIGPDTKEKEADSNSWVAAIFKAALGQNAQMQSMGGTLELKLDDSLEKEGDKDTSEPSPRKVDSDAVAPTVHDRLYQHFVLSYHLGGTKRSMTGKFSKPVPFFQCRSVRIEYSDIKHITGPGLAGFTGSLGKKRLEMNFVIGNVKVSGDLADEIRDIYIVSGQGWWPIGY